MPRAPEYITVANAAGSPVAFLAPGADAISDCSISAELNGPCSATFRLPATSDKIVEILPERQVQAGGRVFVLLAPSCIEKIRDGRKTWFQVTAPERWIELGKVFATVANDSEPGPAWGTVSILASDLGQGGFPAGSAGSALYRLLAGSGWTVGTVDVSGTHDLETEAQSTLANIQEIQATWGGYIVWDSVNQTVSLRDETTWQPGTGVRFQYAKNLKGVTRTVDTDLVTRLYPFGQDDLSIASVNGGQLYIDDTHYTSTVYEGIYRNQEIDDPAELLLAAQKVLTKQSEPRVSYEIDLADLSALPEYAHESFELGDIVRVIDPELSVDAVARVTKYSYEVFQPWKAAVTVGDPAETLAGMIAGTRRAAEFVGRVLKPNPGTGNLLKGFVSAFTTTIKSANGKLTWSDDALEAIEIDIDGVATGKRVRITPGGIGISTNHGVDYDVAITGQGILANRIIVSDLYALASDDGYTQVKGDGLHVFDALAQERVHVGRWLIGAVEHYGIRIFTADGTVLLDDEGSLQTWERPGGGELDSTHPVQLEFYLPPETKSIHRALLRFKLKSFRATSTGAASGGSSSPTTSTEPTQAPSTSTEPQQTPSTSNQSQTVPTSAPGVWTLTSYPLIPDFMDLSGTHDHGVPNGTVLTVSGGGTVTFFRGGSHAHSMYSVYHVHDVTIPGHYHTVTIPSHFHTVTIPGHYHTVAIGPHTHPMVYGIYEGPVATTVTIKINGTDCTAALGGPFTVNQDGLNIAPYLTVGIWNVIEIGSASLGKIDATVFLQAKMGV